MYVWDILFQLLIQVKIDQLHYVLKVTPSEDNERSKMVLARTISFSFIILRLKAFFRIKTDVPGVSRTLLPEHHIYIKNKSANFICYESSTSADIFVITESWLSERDVADKAHITLPGYKLFEHQRVGRKGRGITLLLNETVDARKEDCGERSSFSLVNGLLNTGLVWLH